MSRTKLNTVLVLLVAGLLTLLLAMSLPNLVLLPEQPFSLGQTNSESSFEVSPVNDEIFQVFRGALALALVLLPIYILHSLMTRGGRRRLVVNLIVVLLLFLLADKLRYQRLLDMTVPQEEINRVELSLPPEFSNLPPTIFQAAPPPWLILSVMVIISILTGIILLAGIAFIHQRMKSDTALKALAETAQNTIDSLQTGGEFEAAIIHCYQEMSRVVKSEKGITRQAAMTPREFEAALMGKGLPQEAIQTLTRLFEQVRYGRQTTTTHEEKLAVSCLTTIVNACGGRYEG